jgi:hypothetical protein
MIMVVIGVFLLASAFATVGYVAGYALARAQGEQRLAAALRDYPRVMREFPVSQKALKEARN